MGRGRHTGLGALLAIPVIALTGCAEPQLEFRGYSDLSSCTEIIDAELAGGAVFQGGYPSEDLENPGYVTELLGSIFEERVRIAKRESFRSPTTTDMLTPASIRSAYCSPSVMSI